MDLSQEEEGEEEDPAAFNTPNTRTTSLQVLLTQLTQTHDLDYYTGANLIG